MSSTSKTSNQWAVQGQRLVNFLARVLNTLFVHPSTPLETWVSRAWLAGLFVAGIGLWCVLLNWGRIPMDLTDWAEVSGPRFAFLQNSVISGQFPLHDVNTSGLRGVTDRFLAIADTMISPQIILLRFLTLGQFFLVDTILLYAIGFIGLLLLWKRYRLSPVAFSVLFLLINFNGHLVDHMAVGHANWVGHFLLPFFVYLLLDLLDGARGWRWVLNLCLVMFAIFLQGDFHLYIWCLMFLAALGLFYPRLFKPVLIAGIFILLVSMVRILPPVAVLSSMDREFKSGYVSITDLVAALVVLKQPSESYAMKSILTSLGWWEFDLYIGLVGLAFAVYFGLVKPLLERASAKFSNYHELLAPSLVIAILAVGRIYEPFVQFPIIPLLSGERVSSRFMVLPLVMLVVVAIMRFQRELDEKKPGPRVQIVLLGLLLLLAHDLWQHLKLWQVSNLNTIFTSIPFDPSLHQAGNHPDPAYTTALIAGAVISVLVFAFLIFKASRERKA